MEFLKDVLGDELYNQVAEKLKGNDKIKLVNLEDGKYISKDKFDALDGTKKKLEADIVDLKKIDAAGLTAAKKKLEKENGDLKLGRKLDKALMDAKAVNVTAVGSLLDMSKISLDDSGNLVGADEQIKALQESQKWAFAQPSVPGSGGNPAPAGGGEDKSTFGDAVTERIGSGE